MIRGGLFLIFLVLLVGAGCSYKGGSLNLGEPKSVYVGTPSTFPINFVSFVDARADKSYVLRVKEGDRLVYINSSQNIEEWLREAFKRELAAAKGGVEPKTGACNLSVTLSKLDVFYDKSSLTGKNLKLFATLSVVSENEKGKVTKGYKFDEEKWIKPTFDNKPLEREIASFLSSSVAAIVADIVGSK